MTSYYDEKTKKIGNLPGIKVVSDDFGNYSQLSSYETFIEYALNQGYTPLKDLFGVGYNFMIHPFGNEDTFEEIKSNTERVKKDTGKKIVFIALSQGCHFVNQFLTSYVDKKWADKYVDSVIYIAPTFGGSGNFQKLVDGEYGQFLTTPNMKKAIYKMPGQLILLPNYILFGETPIIRNYPQDGQNTKASEVKNFLTDYLKIINDDNRKIFDEIENFLKQPIPEPPVQSYIIYNTGLNTPSSYKIEKYTEKLKIVLGRGDGEISPESAEFACSNWTNVKCFDWKLNKQIYSHSNMINDDSSLEKIFSFIGNSNDNEEKSSSSDWPIILGAIIICGLQIAIVVCSLIFVIPKQYPKQTDTNDLTTVENNVFPSTSEV